MSTNEQIGEGKGGIPGLHLADTAERSAPLIAAGPGSSRPVEPRIGLALGGGFARGLAHVGVLRVFEKHGVPVHLVAGVSAGAIVAAAFASGCTADDIEKVGASMRFRDVARWTMSRLGFAGSERMCGFLKRLLRYDRFENMKVPLAIVATSLADGRPVVFRGAGDVVLAVRASCSYPGLFLPMQHQGQCLVDGAMSMEVPAQPLIEMGATHVISVHLPNPESCGQPSSMFTVVNRCFQIMSTRLETEWRRQSALVISPKVADVPWDGFVSAREMVRLGEEAATAALPQIERWLAPARASSGSAGLPIAV